MKIVKYFLVSIISVFLTVLILNQYAPILIDVPKKDSLLIDINFEKDERIFDAVLTLTGQPLDARNARRAILSYPLMTVKVVAGIYWEALRLFLKGVSLHSHPKRSH